jgi:hypothetical protein
MIGKPADGPSWFCFLALLAMLIGLEGFCADLAFDTLGEVTSSMLIAAATCNLLPAILFAMRLRGLAVAVALLIALAVIPYQLVLDGKLRKLEQESSEIIAWAYGERVRTGRFPGDLATYRFRAPQLKAHFTDYRVIDGGKGFAFSFWVGTRGTSHSFGTTLDRGSGWGYYPD